MNRDTARVWEADSRRKSSSQMAAFVAFVEQATGRSFPHWHDLHQWSITETSEFWAILAEFSGIRWSQRGPTPVYIPPSRGKMRGAKWFAGWTLNFAQNLLPEPNDREVLFCYSEFLGERRFSGLQLHNAVARLALAMARAGIRAGDHVGAVVTNGPEAIFIMLATASLGAVFASCSPDFGVGGIVDRLGQVQPRLLFFSERYSYNGKICDGKSTLQAMRAQINSIALIVLIDSSAGETVPDTIRFADFLTQSGMRDASTPLPLEFAPLPFDHPLYILFSSGTTGTPKCIVHSAGGTLLQHKKELLLHCDIVFGDTLFYFTTCSWMMWNWMVSGLAVGARLVTFDGSPSYPDLGVLWRLVARERVAVFGTSPKFLRTCVKANWEPQDHCDLSALRTILATGSPLVAELYEWVYSSVKSDIHLASISGGTDIVSCFMLGNPLLPVYPGEIQGPGLGMDISARREDFVAVTEEKAELVCTTPFVAMPVYFLNDQNGEKYHNAYFNFFPQQEVWRHGDYVEITARGGIIVHGRSDATLNPAGVRIGTAEIYQQVESFREIEDAIVVPWRHGGDEVIILFVRLAPGATLSHAFVDQVKTRIRKELTPRHVPAHVRQVQEIPYTQSGKKVEIAAAQALHGEVIKNLTALVNPQCLEEYRTFGHTFSFGAPD